MIAAGGGDTLGHDAPQICEVYLCQVSEGVSCGACCGLYNVVDLSRRALSERLLRQTRRFAETPRTEEGIEQFRRAVEGWTPEERPFPQFHHCPFLGLIGQAGTRVGCLLHPDAPGNQGQDFRFMSYYGAKACASYFCSSSRLLPSRHLNILRDLFDDWFAYGLIITEHRLLETAFSILETRLGRPVSPLDFAPPSAASNGLRDLFHLKLAWPHRPAEAPGPCHFVFDNGLYPRPDIHWPSTERPDPYYGALFREMESRFETVEDIHRASALLDHHFAAILEGLQ